ncbi:rod shape-determining protein MreC [Pseudoflavitalea sp. G-6-1-2]|uniref:rod shape-determining protein MreC n=1 Tax=Pseudoflavitalea sp. G-6-1-2 TaxID=2728841 RepID=UPI00146B1FAE|nr:rod shape-determining protein MreC [Pseudoflavitalea sp. G-6-1-2]NML19473.1 rod shape-determining protein MreC [Pseudoflavitalea sp. G-6-1-2]
MRNIFVFIRKFFNFFFFLVMQIAALYMLFHYNQFHEAAFMGVANEITGKVSKRYNNIEYYFHLKKTNESLAKENERLRNMLKEDFEVADTSAVLKTDSIPYDTTGIRRKYLYRDAKVVNRFLVFPNNYFSIHRGTNQGVRKDMGVISPDGVMGVVVNASENYSVVMSLLHLQSSVSGRVKKSGETGQVYWDGKSSDAVIMKNLPKSVPITKGDSIVTSQYGTYFPPGILIGTVTEIVDDKSSNFYVLKLKTATNFSSVEHSMVVENLQAEEQKKLEEAVKKNQ